MHPFRAQAKDDTERRLRKFGHHDDAPETRAKKIAKSGSQFDDKNPRKKLATGGAATSDTDLHNEAPAKKRLDRKPRGNARGPSVNIIIADKPDSGMAPPPMAGPPPPMPMMPPPGAGAPPPGPGGMAPPPMGAMAPQLANNPMLRNALAARAAPAGGPMASGGGVEPASGQGRKPSRLAR